MSAWEVFRGLGGKIWFCCSVATVKMCDYKLADSRFHSGSFGRTCSCFQSVSFCCVSVRGCKETVNPTEPNVNTSSDWTRKVFAFGEEIRDHILKFANSPSGVQI